MSKRLSSQLRAAYHGVTVDEVYRGREAYEINVKLDSHPDDALADLERSDRVFPRPACRYSACGHRDDRTYARILTYYSDQSSDAQ